MARHGRGEGTIGFDKGRELWVGRVSLGYSAGKRRRKALYGRTRKEAAQRLTAVLRAQHQGLPIAQGRLTTGTYLAKWVAGAKATVRASTWRRYEELTRLHLTPRLGSISLAKLAPADVSAALAAMLEAGSAPRTVRNARVILGLALRQAETAGTVARNVARLTRPPRVIHEEMQTLGASQVQALLRAAEDDRLRALYLLAFSTGARQGELLAIRWSDVDFEAGAVRVVRTLGRDAEGRLAFGEPKTAASRRTIPLGPSTVEALRAHRRLQAEERLRAGAVWQDQGLFTTEVGEPLDGREVTRSFRRLLALAGLPRIRFHDARHSAATLMLEAGTNPKVVAERLGHSTPTITLAIYSHVGVTMQREAAGVLDRAIGG